MNIIQAAVIDFNKIKITVDNFSEFMTSKFQIMNNDEIIPVERISTNDNMAILILSNEINIKKECSLIYDNTLNIKCNYYRLFSSEAFNSRYFYDGKLGIEYNVHKTKFKVWSPVASSVNLLLYKNGDVAVTETPTKIHMSEEEKGIWTVIVNENLDGFFYTYEVEAYNKINEAVDPYAKALGVNGLRGAVINMNDTDPKDWDKDFSPNNLESFTDAVIYEISIRDVTINPNSGVINKGKFLGLTDEHTLSVNNLPTALNHMLELGVTHVQIMPMFDFSYNSVDEKNPIKYNWGYDPQNYNAPEGSYATNPYDPKCRILELKQMVQAFHKNGLSINMDVVYNHMISVGESNFSKIFPGYYFRRWNDGALTNGSGCGNDTASENKMMRKFIVDSVLYWTKEYHLDGFRFDLMGIHDIDTMNLIRKGLDEFNRPIMLYGEGWELTTNIPKESKAIIANSSKTPKIGYFNDIIRDSVKGSVFYFKDGGFVNGKQGLEDKIKLSVIGCIDGYSEALKGVFTSPEQSVNYVSCHDNNTLWDKINHTNESENEQLKMDRHKLALGIVLTSQGIPFLHSGCEFCRTKNGVEDSYNSRDSINWIDWDRKYQYLDVFNFTKCLVELRKYHPAFRMTSSQEIKKNIMFINNTPKNTIAFVLNDPSGKDNWKRIMVIYNANNSSVNIPLPDGTWNLVVNKHSSNINTIKIAEHNINVDNIDINVLYSEA
ncbi:MAG: type I pullulanase [Bacillota bacterium]|nr:type I pullulanase [Bacillota bacterium]